MRYSFALYKHFTSLYPRFSRIKNPIFTCNLKELFDSISANPKMEVEVNLPEQTITNKATGKIEHFEINAYKKHCLMNGLDDIDFLVENKDKIEAWENKNEA